MKNVCRNCLSFYCCHLSLTEKQCPIIPAKPADKPFDYEFGSLRQRMAEELARQQRPYIPWDATEGKDN